MSIQRREFLAATAAAGAALAFGSPAASAFASRQRRTVAPLNLLILGGTAFLGPETIAAAQARGHSVTIFNRGRTEKRLGTKTSDKVQRIYGNRDPEKLADDKQPASADNPKGLAQLEGKTFDAVIDNSGYFPRIVKASAEWAAKASKHYIFISTVSVYSDMSKPGGTVTDAVGTLSDPENESFGAGFERYGPMKVLCEKAAEAAMPGKVANVRPGLIVGPGDPTGRFTYWPVRADQGGEMLCPNKPEDPMQIIDVRDLAEWVITIAENKVCGTFDAVGPQTGLTMGSIVDACKAATKNDVKPVWIPYSFLQEHNVAPWGELPAWLPPEGETAGAARRDISASVKAGLKFRPIGDTCKATLEWYNKLAADSPIKRVEGLKPDKEKAVLEAWKKKNG